LNYNPSEQVDSLSKRLTILLEEEVYWKSYPEDHFIGLSVYAKEGFYCIGKYQNNTLEVVELEKFKNFEKDLKDLYLRYTFVKGMAHIPSPWKPFLDKFNIPIQSRLTRKEVRDLAIDSLRNHVDNTLLVPSPNMELCFDRLTDFIINRTKSTTESYAFLMMFKAYQKRGENVLENRIV